MVTRSETKKRQSHGFTIVELLIVIIVIAILATIVTVAYHGVQKRTMQSLVQNTARQTAKAMENKKTLEGSYPTTFPDTVTVPSGVGLGITQVGSSEDYCFNVTTQKYDDIFYSIDQTGELKQTLCAGAVIATVGDYNTSAGGAVADYRTASSAGHAVAPGDMEFTAQTNDNWTSLTLSWKAMPGATQYRVNMRTSETGTWYARLASNGTNTFNWDDTGETRSSNVAPSTTSLIWTSSIPPDMSSSYEYRIQYKNGEGVWSDFQTLTLSPMTGRVLPAPEHFKVTPSADWSQITISWDGIGNLANIPELRFRVNMRTSSTGTWYARLASNGTGTYSWNDTGTTRSSSVAPSTTSLTWTGSIPPDATSIYEYRIQLFSGTATSDWSTFLLNPLEGTSLPTPANFKVTPSADWSQIVVSWDSIGAAANIPGTKLRLNSRTSPTATWYARATSGGWGTFPWDSISSTSYSSMITPTTTSLTWIYGMPSAGETYEYRIQTYSGTAASDWATVSVPR